MPYSNHIITRQCLAFENKINLRTADDQKQPSTKPRAPSFLQYGSRCPWLFIQLYLLLCLPARVFVLVIYQFMCLLVNMFLENLVMAASSTGVEEQE